jgi:hypothetical protein
MTMSLELVYDFAQELPPRLREDVVGYARSVQSVLPDIFRDAEIAQDEALGNQLVFVAGIKKLYAICSSNFWILDNSLQSLRTADTFEVRMGSLRVSRGSREWIQLRELLGNLEALLSEQRIFDVVLLTSYPEILHRLRDGH